VQRRLGFVQMLDERDDPALVLEYLLFDWFLPLILEGDLESLVQECKLPQSLGKHVETKVERLEDLPIGFERDRRATALRFTCHLERSGRLAALVALLEHLAVLPNFQLEPFGERVDHRDPDAMEPARYGIGALLELATRMQDRQRHFGGRFLLRGMHPGRNTTAVIHDRDAIVDVDRHFDRLTEPRHMLIDTVID